MHGFTESNLTQKTLDIMIVFLRKVLFISNHSVLRILQECHLQWDSHSFIGTIPKCNESLNQVTSTLLVTHYWLIYTPKTTCWASIKMVLSLALHISGWLTCYRLLSDKSNLWLKNNIWDVDLNLGLPINVVTPKVKSVTMDIVTNLRVTGNNLSARL